MTLISRFRLVELTGAAVLASYLYVFGFKNNQSYLDSKFWLSVSKPVIRSIIPFQLLAGIGAITWYWQVSSNPPQKGILSYTVMGAPAYQVLMMIFLLGSLAWPFTLLQNGLIENKTMTKTLITCSTLWIAAIAAIIMLGGTFEADNTTPSGLVGITLFATVVVLLDGVGWSARLIHQTIYR